MRKVFILQTEDYQHSTAKEWAEQLSKSFNFEIDFFNFSKNISAENLSKTLEEKDAALLLIELTNKKNIQQYLNLCRNLRIPYLFLQPNTKYNLSKISLPVTFLVEDKEKAPFASALGRFCNSQIIIYKPKDYGSKAQETINQCKTLFDSFSLNYIEKQGKKGSFGVEKEAVLNAKTDGCSLVIISASREYGLDDIIFGSKEKKILQLAKVPVLLINPRADLYVLCD